MCPRVDGDGRVVVESGRGMEREIEVVERQSRVKARDARVNGFQKRAVGAYYRGLGVGRGSKRSSTSCLMDSQASQVWSARHPLRFVCRSYTAKIVSASRLLSLKRDISQTYMYTDVSCALDITVRQGVSRMLHWLETGRPPPNTN